MFWNWIGHDRVAHFIKTAGVMPQVDPVDHGLLERKNGKKVLAPVPAEQWITHLADMNWPYTMGAAQLYTWPLLKQVSLLLIPSGAESLVFRGDLP